MKNDKFINLISSLQLIALPFEQQVEMLPSFVSQADEIALIFDGIYRSTKDDKSLSLPIEVMTILASLDKLLEEMSEKKDLWTQDALENRQVWENCRNLAKSVLNELNEPLVIPKLNFIQFVESD